MPDPTGHSPVDDGGVLADGGPGETPRIVSYPTTCANGSQLTPGRSPLRRLTVDEYDNTVRDLLNDTTGPASRLVDAERGATSADARIITPLLTEQYLTAAEDIVDRLDLNALMQCGGAVTTQCGRSFIAGFLSRAFRRPPSSELVVEYEAFFDAVESELGAVDAASALIEAVLQSPHFLYRLEMPIEGQPIRSLDGYEMATRLSYFLWSTMPDASLWESVDSLETVDGVETAARRMVSDARAEATIQRFFAHYLELDALDELAKDPTVYPSFNASIPPLLRQEAQSFVRQVVVHGDASWRSLMTAPWTMADQALGSFYGLTVTADEFVRVELDGDYHAGLLTQGALMASRARSYETSPIHRGMFVRGTLLCGIVPDVPEGLEVTPPDPDPTLTTRQRLSEHRANPVCGSCHRQLDPLGFAFEHFDGAGRFRAQEGDLEIDASGEVVESLDVDGEFDGAVELAQRIVDSEQGQTCFAAHWYRFSIGRALADSDGCDLQSLVGRFRASELDIRELLVGLTLTDAFRHRSEEVAQ